MTDVVIVGGGPRAIALIERIGSLADGPVDITVVDDAELGVGRVWRVDQPRSVIMNAVAVDSTMFFDDSVTIDGPGHDGPAFFEWCHSEHAAALPEADLVAEAAGVQPFTCVSRALYGAYLRWHAGEVLRGLPADVTVRQVHGRVTDVVPVESAWRATVTTEDAVLELTAPSVVLAIGWGQTTPSTGRLRPAGSAIDQGLDSVGVGQRVLLRGLGLSFIDAVSLLTEARGGRFETASVDEQGRAVRLRYVPSGQEPQIFAYSRSGVPFSAKPAWTGRPRIPSMPHLTRVAGEWDFSRPGDFETQLWPAIEQDALAAYRAAGGTEDVDSIDRTLPLQQPFATDEEYAAAALDYLHADIDECLAGEPSPLKAMHLALNAARPMLARFMRFDGLTPEGYEDYRQFMRFVGLIGCVPPLERNQQLAALIEAGVVTLVRGDADADVVVEARVPRPSPVQHEGLLPSLYRAGRATPYAVGGTLMTDALRIDRKDGSVFGTDGPQHGLFSVGIPSEDQRGQTIFAPIPGADSDVFQEAHATASAVLARIRTHERTP